MKNKVLIIRLSSFGDIVQCMAVLDSLTQEPLEAEVDWLAREDLAEVPALSPKVNKVWSFNRKEGLLGWIKLGLKLRDESYTHIYDAHSSLRSRILCFILRPFGIGPQFVRRSKERIKRILLFKFRVNKFPNPFRGMISYHKPLESFGINPRTSFRDSFVTEERLPYEGILLAPSAAWEMKRWPMEHFKKLIEIMHDKKFVILGGPADHFCQELEDIDPNRVTNLAGKLTYKESCQLVAQSTLLISGDTGMIHVADLLGVNGISLVGPTAFGFATNDNIKTLEVDLECRPCTKDGRGECSQAVYKKCLVDITPELVAKTANSF
ncbi:MAG: heptosyltransferase-2 [Bacteriovoracaceae bacterium]|jgi:heptosyltransferase-2